MTFLSRAAAIALALVAASSIGVEAQGVLTAPKKSSTQPATTKPATKTKPTKTTPGKQPKAEKPEEPKEPAVAFRRQWRHLDYAVLDCATGDTLFVTATEFAAAPEWQQNRHNRLGVVIDHGTEAFIVAPPLSEKRLWKDARTSAPGLAQAEAIIETFPQLKTAIRQWWPQVGDDRYECMWTSAMTGQSEWSRVIKGGKFDTAGNQSNYFYFMPVIATLRSNEASLRTMARHLDIEACRDGRYYYFTPEEWQRLSKIERNGLWSTGQGQFRATGVVIDDGGFRFVFDPSKDGYFYPWQNAVNKHPLPSRAQAQVIVKNAPQIENVLNGALGWTVTNPNVKPTLFWTTDKDGDKNAYAINWEERRVVSLPIMLKKKEPARYSVARVYSLATE